MNEIEIPHEKCWINFPVSTSYGRKPTIILLPEIQEWLMINRITYRTYCRKKIIYEEKFSENFMEGTVHCHTVYSAFIEIRDPKQAALFKLTWC